MDPYSKRSDVVSNDWQTILSKACSLVVFLFLPGLAGRLSCILGNCSGTATAIVLMCSSIAYTNLSYYSRSILIIAMFPDGKWTCCKLFNYMFLLLFSFLLRAFWGCTLGRGSFLPWRLWPSIRIEVSESAGISCNLRFWPQVETHSLSTGYSIWTPLKAKVFFTLAGLSGCLPSF